MTTYLTTDTDLTSIANAIRTKGGTSAPLTYPLGFVSAINNIEGGGGGDEDKPVKFIDYDGTLVASYTLEETAALSALPACPTHTGLTSQGWNYTLAEVKSQASAMGSCIVGHNLVTDNGDTRLYIKLDDSRFLSPSIGLGVKGTLTIDWGDGTATGTLTGTSLTTRKNISHTYSSIGEYTISITPASNTKFQTIVSGTNVGTYWLFDYSQSLGLDSTNTSIVYSKCIKHVELGTGISQLSKYAFQNCIELKSITIPSSVTSIGNYAFAYCQSLQSITIPSEVTSINNGAFLSCYLLTSISIPSGVTTLNSSNIFQYCYSLQLISIPSGVTFIGSSTFQYCYSLTSITIPSGVTSIEASTFNYCYSLKSITIPSGVTSIGINAFQYCYSLTSITIPSEVTSIGNYTFNYCYSLKSITIPSKVTSIGNYAFACCYSLESATIPSNVTSIGTNAFYSCYLLQSITIPSKVTSIGNYAFACCYSLTSITVPSDVTSIGTYAFQQNRSLYHYYLYPITPPTLSNTNTFIGIQAATKIHVPAASLSTYQSASYWSTYSSYMVGDL